MLLLHPPDLGYSPKSNMDIEIWGVRERHHKLSPRDCHHCMKEFKRFVRWPHICLQDCLFLELRLFTQGTGVLY